jgi:hypothetical protein
VFVGYAPPECAASPWTRWRPPLPPLCRGRTGSGEEPEDGGASGASGSGGGGGGGGGGAQGRRLGAAAGAEGNVSAEAGALQPGGSSAGYGGFGGQGGGGMVLQGRTRTVLGGVNGGSGGGGAGRAERNRATGESSLRRCVLPELRQTRRVRQCEAALEAAAAAAASGRQAAAQAQQAAQDTAAAAAAAMGTLLELQLPAPAFAALGTGGAGATIQGGSHDGAPVQDFPVAAAEAAVEAAVAAAAGLPRDSVRALSSHAAFAQRAVQLRLVPPPRGGTPGGGRFPGGRALARAAKRAGSSFRQRLAGRLEVALEEAWERRGTAKAAAGRGGLQEGGRVGAGGRVVVCVGGWVGGWMVGWLDGWLAGTRKRNGTRELGSHLPFVRLFACRLALCRRTGAAFYDTQRQHRCPPSW